ncbi:MAG TPA: GTP cyclohydrolase I FolE [Candidatus Binatia bacterium]|nr:GTP cyclohydrolase I FolE [Candidatus Binatia bacterium]
MQADNIEVVPIEMGHRNGNGHRSGRWRGDAANRRGLRPEQYEKIKLLLRSLLAVLGEDPERDGLLGTPQRMARMYGELLSGYEINVNSLVNGALFDVQYDEMIVVKDIEFYSLCEHHLLPFFGRAHVAYLPGEHVIGLSKIPRIVEMYARRLQVQERLTQEIAEQLEAVLQPRGVAVVMEGTHLCAAMRGVRQQDARMRTSVTRGCFRTDRALRAEFLQQLSPGSVT